MAAGGAAAGLILVGAAGILHAPATTPAVACPALDAACRPVATPDGVLTTPDGRWSLGQSGDIVVLGRWLCGATALPALLEPGTGEVWIFDRWAGEGSDVAARFLGQVLGATGLIVQPAADGCDRLEVLGPGARRTSLDPS